MWPQQHASLRSHGRSRSPGRHRCPASIARSPRWPPPAATTNADLARPTPRRAGRAAPAARPPESRGPAASEAPADRPVPWAPSAQPPAVVREAVPACSCVSNVVGRRQRGRVDHQYFRSQSHPHTPVSRQQNQVRGEHDLALLRPSPSYALPGHRQPETWAASALESSNLQSHSGPAAVGRPCRGIRGRC